MTSRLLISLSLLLMVAQKTCAQLAPAADFFNSGAQLYISNNVPAALDRVETGLKIYPDDMKLKKLAELLKQQQQSQSSQSQQNQPDQSQPQKSDSQKSQQPQQPPKKSEDQPTPDEQKQAAQPKDGDQPEDKNAEAPPVKPGEMTPADAKRLLDAQRGNEQLLQLKPPVKPPDHQKPFKDW